MREGRLVAGDSPSLSAVSGVYCARGVSRDGGGGLLGRVMRPFWVFVLAVAGSMSVLTEQQCILAVLHS